MGDALFQAMRSVLPELVQHVLGEDGAAFSLDASGIRSDLRKAADEVRWLDEQIEGLASRAYDIEHSLKQASSWASSLNVDIRPVRSR